MLIIGMLGLIAFGFGIENILGSPEVQRRDVIPDRNWLDSRPQYGLSEANRLRHSSWSELKGLRTTHSYGWLRQL